MSERMTTEVESFEAELLNMTPAEVVDFIVANGARVSEIERNMNLAGEVLESGGYTVEAILEERENGRTTEQS